MQEFLQSIYPGVKLKSDNKKNTCVCNTRIMN